VALTFDLSRYAAVLFDLDGVLTDTAELHADAWKVMFDEFLHRWSADHGHPFIPFESETDYLQYVDGKPRYEGVASFLESRRIVLPEGAPDDPADADTICGLGNRKNELVQRLIIDRGVEVLPGSIEVVEDVRAAGLKTAIVSSSRNANTVLQVAKIDHLFDEVVDGTVADSLDLPGKPAPDTLLEAARRLQVQPGSAVDIEDTIVGVEAGRLGGFGYVIGVAHEADAARLGRHGADVVVGALDELLAAGD
jgi:beta-phosphoglucomutase family hydrolase